MINCKKITLNCGVEIPEFGLGVFRSQLGSETSNAVKWALQAGYRHIDTAMMYRNEADVARGVRESGVARDEIFITSKLAVQSIADRKFAEGVKSSLKALDTDYIDLYLLHWPVTNFADAWRTLTDYRDKGSLRAIGVSNFQIRHLERLEKEGLALPAVNQIELHPSFQERELKAYCEERGIRIEAWSPLGGADFLLIDRPEIQKIAKKYSKTGAQVLIRWHLDVGNIVIPKSVKQHRIVENADVFDFNLDAEDLAAIAKMDTGKRSYWSPDRWD
jgi:2,5-diketo-D-gluconate reductase A